MALTISGSGGGNAPVVGSYTGNGSSVSLTFSQVPVMIIINCTDVPTSGNNYMISPAIYFNGKFLWAGKFSNNSATGGVYTPTTSSGGKTIKINTGHLIKSGTVYNYIAFF